MGCVGVVSQRGQSITGRRSGARISSWAGSGRDVTANGLWLYSCDSRVSPHRPRNRPGRPRDNPAPAL